MGQTNDHQIQESELVYCIDYWLEVLNLEHWRVSYKVVEVTKLPNALLEICPTRTRHIAVIFIRKGLLETLSRKEFQQLLVHELVHLLYDALVEEHDFQLKFCTTKDRQQENRDRFTRILEKTVEQTAVILCTSLGAASPLLNLLFLNYPV